MGPWTRTPYSGKCKAFERPLVTGVEAFCGRRPEPMLLWLRWWSGKDLGKGCWGHISEAGSHGSSKGAEAMAKRSLCMPPKDSSSLRLKS